MTQVTELDPEHRITGGFEFQFEVCHFKMAAGTNGRQSPPKDATPILKQYVSVRMCVLYGVYGYTHWSSSS